MRYVKQIDSLRAIAVLMVIMSHWVPKTSSIIPFGEIGVDIFFVISGFLISSILLIEKEKTFADNKSFVCVLKNFVSRRALRIFPIYYLSLFIFWLMQDYNSYHLREHIGFYVTYTSNILFFIQDGWDGYLAPLWSLAVEEQFYLIWPLLMIFAPKRYTFPIILVSILTGLIFPYLWQREMVKVLTPSCMSALGIGALLAWLNINKREMLFRYKNVFSVVGLFSLILIILISLQGNYIYQQVQIRIVVSIVTFVILLYCIGIYKPTQIIEWILNSSLLIFIGQISYGLYLYHNLISIVAKRFVEEYFNNIIMNTTYSNAVWLVMKFSFLILSSWVSFKFIERPFLNLKKYFVLD